MQEPIHDDPHDEHEQAKAAVLAANEEFYRAFRERDLDAMGRVWALAAPVACTHPAWTVLRGRRQVIASWRAILLNPDAPAVEVRDAVVHRLAPDAAVVLCREVVDGGQVEATNVFVREDGEWRIAHHHASAVARQLSTRVVPGEPMDDRRN